MVTDVPPNPCRRSRSPQADTLREALQVCHLVALSQSLSGNSRIKMQIAVTWKNITLNGCINQRQIKVKATTRSRKRRYFMLNHVNVKMPVHKIRLSIIFIEHIVHEQQKHKRNYLTTGNQTHERNVIYWVASLNRLPISATRLQQAE